MRNTEIQIIIPVYNEEAIISELWERLRSVGESLDSTWSLMFVNDGSSDSTADLINDLCEKEDHVDVIHLSRNFGHAAALSAGVDHASGEAIILMDGDLQDRPEAIPDFISKWKEGYDVIYATRASRKENPLMRFFFKFFYKLLAKFSGIDQPLDAGIFGLLDKKVVGAIKAMPENNRYFPGLRAYAGYRQAGVTVDRDERYAGAPKVGIRGLFRLAMNAIFAFSYFPLRLVTLLGLIVAGIAFLYIALILYFKIFTDQAISGWASNLGATLFLGGVQLVMLGIVGEYIGRIYEETKNRPHYYIAEKRGDSFSQDHES